MSDKSHVEIEKILDNKFDVLLSNIEEEDK